MDSAKKKYRYTVFYCLLFFSLLILCIIAASSVGSADLNPFDSLRIIASKVPGIRRLISAEDISDVYFTIIFQIRLPRIMLAGFVGSGLALVGAVFQGLFRNPLADPHILGVSSGAAVGATIAILAGMQINFLGLGAIGCLAFLGALLTVMLVYQLACTGPKVSSTALVLTGTAVSTMLSAVISLLMTINRDGIERVYYWTLGSFSSASWAKVVYFIIFLGVGGSILLFHSRELNLLSAGEETAASLGMEIGSVRKRLILAASCLVAAAVSVSGIIGFVGLIIPHCMRILAGADHRKLLPLSLFGGAIFLIVCDTLARTVTAPAELPVGVVTSLLGAPYFIFLLYRSRTAH